MYYEQNAFKADYNSFTKYYDLRAEVIRIEDGSNSFIFHLIKKNISKSIRIIDVGCGRGFMLNPISRINRSVTGYDLSEKNVELCKSNGLNAIQYDCVENIPESNNSVDLVICTELLEHLQEDSRKKLLINIYKCLKLNGLLLISVPYNENYERNICSCPNCSTTFHRFGHVGVLSENEIIKQLKLIGFSGFESKVAYPQLRRYRLPYFIWTIFSTFRLKKEGQLIISAVKSRFKH